MIEKTHRPVLKRVNPDGAAPGTLASKALQMAGIKSFPVPTDTILAIGAECFGVRTGGQLSFTVDLSSDKPSIPEQKSPHELRYDAALKIGTTLFPNRQYSDAKLFARSLLLPKSTVEKFLNNSYGRPDLSVRKLAELALSADVPTRVVIERLGDIRNHGLSPQDISAGFTRQRSADKGFICTNRGIKRDATEVTANIDGILAEKYDAQAPVPNIFVARTDYDGTEEIYAIRAFPKYEYVCFKRPTGEEETLLRFHLAGKIPSARERMPNAVFINIDSDRFTQK